MRIHHRRRGGFYKKEETVAFKANEAIKALEVYIIDEEGQPAGVRPIAEALAFAQERGFDLVEVSPKASPPVCKLLDFGQFKYQKEKELRQQKAHAKKVDVKGIRLSVKMGEHDLDIRRKQAESFLAEGHKLKIEINLRGREKEHGEIANQRIGGFLQSLEAKYPLNVEQAISRSGGNVSTIVGRKS
ncbi:translation initiation factor IF-3 [Patescibacteria group bacterium]|nr:translation initiation factor IF-3 [Patescibacteria group bacterium]